MRGAAPHALGPVPLPIARAGPRPQSVQFPTLQANLERVFLVPDLQANAGRICFHLIANALSLAFKCRTLRSKIKR